MIKLRRLLDYPDAVKKHIVRLDGRRLFVFEPPLSARSVSPKQNAPHSTYCTKRRDIVGDCAALKQLCVQVGHIGSVLETFGGSGWHSSIIQAYCSPAEHVALEIDSYSCRSNVSSNPGVIVRQCDSFAEMARIEEVYDWVHADFNNFTLGKSVKDKKQSDMLGNLFRSSRRYVTITDSAIYGLIKFQNVRDAYSKMFDADLASNWQEYYRLCSETYSSRYEFGVIKTLHWCNAAILLLERGAQIQNCAPEKALEKLPYSYLRARIQA